MPRSGGMIEKLDIPILKIIPNTKMLKLKFYNGAHSSQTKDVPWHIEKLYINVFNPLSHVSISKSPFTKANFMTKSKSSIQL